MLAMPVPLSLAFAISVLVAVAAWKGNALTVSGAVAAAVVGSVALHARLGFGALLIAWFLLATVVSKFGGTQKRERMRGIVDKGNRRDATQVLANGGVFALLALFVMILPAWGSAHGALAAPMGAAALGAAGSLAAAGADTWATEFGVLTGGAPWSLRTRSRVPPGTSGAVSVTGCLAMVVAAALMAVLAMVFEVVPADGTSFRAVFLGGMSGAMVDTIIGATMQEVRWCPRCAQHTEQQLHECGTRTVRSGGISICTNDFVNFVCAVTGAVVAALSVLF